MAGLSFFFADARTARTPRLAQTASSASLLGDLQSRDLDKWIADRSLPGPKFIVSASMVLPRRLAVRDGGTESSLRSDAWDGYPSSLYRLLATVSLTTRNGIDRVDSAWGCPSSGD